jgi:hypothetical protein
MTTVLQDDLSGWCLLTALPYIHHTESNVISLLRKLIMKQSNRFYEILICFMFCDKTFGRTPDM